jgi:hypothetical protein
MVMLMAKRNKLRGKGDPPTELPLISGGPRSEPERNWDDPDRLAAEGMRAEDARLSFTAPPEFGVGAWGPGGLGFVDDGPEVKGDATPANVAQWMYEEVKKRNRLDQKWAAAEIRHRFGRAFVYVNKNDNLAIREDVLHHFHKLTPDTVVWLSGSRIWRRRYPTDRPGRRQPG